jgi:hypothetical protein
MNAIQEVIHLMSNEDIKSFKVHLNKKNKRKDVHNIELFNSLINDDIKEIKNSFNEEKTANAYHALTKRLYDSLVEFMANRSFENDTSDEHEVLRLLVITRVFFEHKLIKSAFKCLAKAETKAIALEHFNLLNEIYHTQIQYAHLNPVLPLDAVIEKFKANKQKLDQEEQLNLGYALLRRELAEIYHKGKIVDFQSFIKNTIESQGISIKEILTFKSLYHILFMANEYASINSNYSLIEPFLIKSYAFINSKEDLAEKHSYYHIHILYLMANIHFRNRRFDEANVFLDKMMEQLQKQNNRYYSRFCLRYFLLRSLTDNYSGNPGNAVHIAEKALEQNKKADPADINDLRLSLIVFHLQQDDGRSASKLMVAFSHSDSWYEKKMGMDWTIKKNLVEILMHTQLEYTELALSRIKSFKRRYKKYLLSVGEERAMVYVSLIEKYVLKPEILTTPVFRNSVESLLLANRSGQEDIFVISFLGWLLAKTKRKPIHETTLDLMNNYFSPSHSA